MKLEFKSKFIYLLLLSLLLTGCSVDKTPADSQNKPSYSQSASSDIGSSDSTNQTDKDKAKKSSSFSLSDVPPYSGSPYVEINDNIPFFSNKDKKRTDSFEKYSKLDSLGRCGTAYANVCKKLQPTEERGSIGMIKPSGWHTVKYRGRVDGNYLYNRCHLIGYQLTGENANEKNLITGTRYMNCEGQLPFENQVDDYVDRTGNHVLYRVTPIFEGDNLIASGVLTEAYSVEDKGKGCSFCEYCYNVQPGIDIDYATGESQISDDKQTNSKTVQSSGKKSVTNKSNNDNVKKEYVLNTNTHKFHKPECSSVSEIHKKNLKNVNKSREEILSEGYEPCKKCNP